MFSSFLKAHFRTKTGMAPLFIAYFQNGSPNPYFRFVLSVPIPMCNRQMTLALGSLG
jgi:hypothetical protein